MQIAVVGRLQVRSLNRNILECKYIATNNYNPYPEVLIETYWNVNVDEIEDEDLPF